MIGGVGKEYDRKVFAGYLEGLRQEANEIYRGASVAAGLDHGALRRYIKKYQLIPNSDIAPVLLRPILKVSLWVEPGGASPLLKLGFRNRSLPFIEGIYNRSSALLTPATRS